MSVAFLDLLFAGCLHTSQFQSRWYGSQAVATLSEELKRGSNLQVLVCYQGDINGRCEAADRKLACKYPAAMVL